MGNGGSKPLRDRPPGGGGGSIPASSELDGRICPCPLAAKLLPYGDREVREFAKRAYLEIASAADGGDTGACGMSEWRMRIFDCVTRQLSESSTASDIGAGFLISLRRCDSKAEVAEMAMKYATLAAVACGIPDPFLEWAAEHEEAIRGTKGAGGLLFDAAEGDRFRRMRFVRCASHGSRRETFLLVEFDTESPFCMSLLDGFLTARGKLNDTRERPFFERFSQSLGFEPTSLDDFGPDSFGRQAGWFKNQYPAKSSAPVRMTRLFYMHLVTLLPPNQRAFTFATGLPAKTLSYKFIVERWLEGYRAVVYEPLDPVPQHPRWLLYPSENEKIKAGYAHGWPEAVDCSVGDPELEALLMRWLWEGGLGSGAVRQAPSWIKALLHRLADEGLSLARGGSSARLVTAGCVRSSLATLAERCNARTLRAAKGKLRAFLSYAESKGGLSVEPACYLLLENANGGSGRRASQAVDAASASHLAALAGELERRSPRSLDDELTYIAFITHALTELRLKEVLALRASDLGASPSRGYKAVGACRKCGGYEYEVVQIPEAVHRLLEAAVKATEPLRSRASEDVADRIFLVGGTAGVVRVLTSEACVSRYGNACRSLGIPAVKPSSVRKTYQTTVIMEGAKRHWGRMLLRPITGHADARSDEAYISPDIMSPETRRYLEGAFVAEIGRPKIRGEVLPDDEIPEGVAALVEGGSGICRNEECDVLGTLPCLECAGFATAPRLIPEMLEAIAALDRQIGSAPLHQREHLVKAKRRYLAYLGIMIDMKGGTA